MRSENDLDIILSGYPELADESVKVSQINIKGCSRTRASVVSRAFTRASQAKTMKELSSAIKDGLHFSSALNIHEKIVIQLGADERDEKGLILNLVVQEKPFKPSFAVGAEVSDKGSKTANAVGKVRSFLGFGEELNLQVSVNQDKNVSFLSRVTLPLYPTLDGSISLSGYSMMKDKVTKLLTSSTNGVSLVTKISPNNEFIYKFDVRRNENYNTTLASTSAVTKEGDEENSEKPAVPIPDSQMWSEVQPISINSSLSHFYTFDSLDDNVTPSKGLKIKVNNTISGLGGVGDVHLASSLIKSSLYLPLVKKNLLTASLQTTIGAAVPLNQEGTIQLNDRFGYERVRGYNTLGAVNAQTEEEYGGNVIATALARVITPVPISFLRNELGMHVHAFCNTGNVDTFDFKKGDAKEFATRFRSGLQSSFGVGLVFNLSFGRVEWNWCRPYLFQGQTMTRPCNKFEWKVVME